jgi:hypothetical protein
MLPFIPPTIATAGVCTDNPIDEDLILYTVVVAEALRTSVALAAVLGSGIIEGASFGVIIA